MALTLGVDTSSYQDPTPTSDPSDDIDWAAVAQAGWQFALCRMTIGRTTRDVTGRRDLHAMLAAGIPVPGAYGVVGYAEPVEDGAKLLLDEIAAAGADPHGCLVMLDAEDFSDGRHPTIDQVDRYAIQLERDLGRPAVAYVPGWWLTKYAYTAHGRALARCPWAQSRYIAQPWTEERLLAYKPADLHGFDSLGWLQYTSSGTVPGVRGRADLNCYYGTLGQLRAQLLGQEDPLMALDQAYFDGKFAMLKTEILNSYRQLDHGTIDKEPAPNSLKEIVGLLDALQATLDGGVAVTLDLSQATPTQIDALASALAGRLKVEGVEVAGNRLVIQFAPEPA